MLLRLCLCTLIAVLALQAQGGGRGGAGIGAGFGRGVGPAGAQQGPAPPPPPSDCAVSGTVVNEMTGEPIPRAMVSLNGFDAAGAATDAKGEWSISNTTCSSNRMVTATRIGFISSQTAAGPTGNRPPTVNLVSGSPVTGIKISLMPESSIAGKVLDANSDPVENARVQTMRVQIQAGQRMVQNVGAAVVDSQGNFRIGGLQPGRYVVCASSPQRVYPVGGGPFMVYREECYPGPASTALSVAMPIEAGREAHTSFTLTPVQGVHVRGTVAGIPENTRLSVLLTSTDRTAIANSNGPVQQDGTFDIRSVLPGSYFARASFPPKPGAQPVILTAAVNVGNSDVDNVALTPVQEGSLSGTVRYEFSNQSTPPNPPVTVNLRPALPALPRVGPIPQAQWDSSHIGFNFQNVQADEENLLNANVNGQTVYIKSATLHGQDVLNHPFKVEGAAGPVDVVVSDDTGSIDITVNDSDGHPVPDTGVLLLSASGLRRILRSGDDGHAKLQNIPTGDYRVWAWDNIQSVPYAEEDWMNQNAGPGEKVSITSGSSANVTVKRQDPPKQ